MKVYLSNYRQHWLSPYHILEKVFFWKEIDYDDSTIDKWADRLAPYCEKLKKFLDFIHPQINYVKIDRYDTWDMDHTLSPIILPMLKQLKETKHGAPNVDDDDVPEELKSTSASPKENDWDTDSNHFKRWDYIMDEMIWAFEQLVDGNWEDQYYTGESDYIFVKDDRGMSVMEKGPKHTQEWDRDGWTKHHERIDNGLRLFGSYYRNLWD
jgi:hypothetical protein